LNDLSLVVSDTAQPPPTLLNLILASPEAVLHFIQSLLELPGVIFRRVIRIILRAGGGKAKTGKVDAVNGKGKTTDKGTRSPTKKRIA
jgi:hypothetical protein